MWQDGDELMDERDGASGIVGLSGFIGAVRSGFRRIVSEAVDFRGPRDGGRETPDPHGPAVSHG